MKKKSFLFITFTVFILVIIFVSTLNAVSLTHEAEASTNKLKYTTSMLKNKLIVCCHMIV
ncbi:MAG: hypothetical protein ABF289_16335 [Clostridiales bacterium]